MKRVNYEELENIIKDYASSKTISKPLMVFGGHYQDARIQIVEKIFGNANFWKIAYKDDDPRPDIPYCLYDVYLGDDNSNAILRNCMSIAANIHRPVFCFFHSSTKEKVPTDIISELEAIEYIGYI